MDEVPWKFVDSVVEMFKWETLHGLAQRVRHPLWKPVVHLHHRNRATYRVEVRVTNQGVQHLFTRVTPLDSGIRFSSCRIEESKVAFQTIREKGRFARIVELNDISTNEFPPFAWREINPLSEVDTVKLQQTISTLIDRVSGSLDLVFGSTDSANMIVTSLFKKAYLQKIRIPYCGQVAYEFLEDQINNSPFLIQVDITGLHWPKSSIDQLVNFCLKGRPGKHVAAFATNTDLVIDSSTIRNLFDLWKTSGKLNFQLYCSGGIANQEAWQALQNEGQLATRKHPKSPERLFQHKTEKSVAMLSNSYCQMQCYPCNCDRFKECLLKKEYPEFHKF
uniref:DUF2851 family protein n=1 Tax=Steinernema glaseri TaxID=37863 RepID=A0A1I7YPG1_9BILA